MKSLVAWGLGAAAAGSLLASGGGCGGGIGGADWTAGCDVPTQRLAPDIMLLLDTAATMSEPIGDPCVPFCTPPSKWAAAADAIRSAVASTDAKVNWGFAFMGGATNTCDAGAIEIPVGGPTDGIGRLLDSRTSPTGALVGGGSRPMRAAVNQAAAHLAQHRGGGRRLMVLIADNVPQCRPDAPDMLADDVDGTTAAITAAAGNNIATFLIGLSGGTPVDGRLFVLTDSGRVLNGDGGFGASAGSAAGVLESLKAIVAHTADCTFAVPPPPDNGTTNDGPIRVEVNGNEINEIGQNTGGGWSYTDRSLQGIQLYGFACDAVRGQAAPNVSIVFPCVRP